MLRRSQVSEPKKKRPVYALRLTGELAEICTLLSFTQLDKLRKTLKAIATHEILNYDKESDDEN